MSDWSWYDSSSQWEPLIFTIYYLILILSSNSPIFFKDIKSGVSNDTIDVEYFSQAMSRRPEHPKLWSKSPFLSHNFGQATSNWPQATSNPERGRLCIGGSAVTLCGGHIFFLSKWPLNTIFYTPMTRDLKKKKKILKIFIIFSRIFKKIFVFSRFFPYKMGNYQRIFDFSIGEALYRSLSYILKKSLKNIKK